ncbi:MAG TPA: MBOAT family O-acyltransferase, partial [Phycisphaerae bacterium]|nr:MBOAT family O-acyltransferase [Phycisphaerae bacterium]
MLLTSTSIDYFCAAQMEKDILAGKPAVSRLKYLHLSLITNLGLLAFFKYFNFFIDSFLSLFDVLGVHLSAPAMRIILPIGISFYTFQALSYTIDVYSGKLHATKSFWDFFLAVLFFPHLIAGPIQRAANLLSQVTSPRVISRTKIVDGLHLMLWGYFKKVYVADGLAPIVSGVFNASTYSGGETTIAVLAFAFQIYCDFSGYTDIARGVAKLMGFEFVLNFNLPYFATNPSDFWKRWHISLSTWLRDYLYVPLGGNQHGTVKTYRNLMITMVLGGLWHGAAWNFVLWGAYHGGLLVVHRSFTPILSGLRLCTSAMLRRLWLSFRILVMFIFTCYGWLLFRATSFHEIVSMTASLARPLDGLPVQSLQTVLTLIAPVV